MTRDQGHPEPPGDPVALRALARWADPWDGSTPSGVIADALEADPDLHTIVFRRRDGAVGAVGRSTFFQQMSGPLGFGWALHAQHTIEDLETETPPLWSADTAVIEAGLSLLASDAPRSCDDVLVADGERIGTVAADAVLRFVGHEYRNRAVIDELTGLPNRRGAMDELAATLATPGPPDSAAAQVLFVDLDRFKLVNDAYGHAAGDEVLREAAGRLSARLPAEATCARIGGDEFFVILPLTIDPRLVGQVTRHVSDTFLEPIRFGTNEVTLGATIGVATALRDMDVTEVFRRADIAMYDGKRRGGNCVAHTANHDVERFTELARVEAALPGAIARARPRTDTSGAPDDGLYAVYQPEISLLDGTVLGAEALARWRSDGQEITPGVFVPIAERCGLIPALTDRMLSLAAADLADRDHRHGRSGYQPFVAVNVSTTHCATSGFARALLRTIEEYGIDPSRLVLEITESVVFDHIDRIIASVQDLAAAGVRVVLDDFGTGYSSLSILTQIPLSGMKLDRSMVVAMTSNDRSLTMVAAMVDLAHRFGLYVVAEGVETSEQHAMVCDVGCDVGQGWLYGRPSPTMPVRSVELPERAPVSSPPLDAAPDHEVAQVSTLDPVPER